MHQGRAPFRHCQHEVKLQVGVSIVLSSTMRDASADSSDSQHLHKHCLRTCVSPSSGGCCQHSSRTRTAVNTVGAHRGPRGGFAFTACMVVSDSAVNRIGMGPVLVQACTMRPHNASSFPAAQRQHHEASLDL